jgi:hypothetical protein
MKTSSDLTADTALAYTPDGARATARGPVPVGTPCRPCSSQRTRTFPKKAKSEFVAGLGEVNSSSILKL